MTAFLFSIFTLVAFCSAVLLDHNVAQHGPEPGKLRLVERQYSEAQPTSPKFLILSMFSGEADVWHRKMPSLFAQAISIPGLSPLFPKLYCNKHGEICQVTLGEGVINAASSMAALVFSNKLDLRKTYFMAAGVAGVSPYMATTGSATFARYAVQFDLQMELDARQKPRQAHSGYVPLFTDYPKKGETISYPGGIYGTEAFELNKDLRDRFVKLAKTDSLMDSAAARKDRKKYGFAPANQPPTVVGCDTGTANPFWGGSFLAEEFEAYTRVITNGTGVYCSSQQEDNAWLEVLVRGALAEKVDFARVAVMRTGSDIDRAPSGVSEADHLVHPGQAGFDIALENLYVAGHPIISDVIQNWDTIYKKGVEPSNYIGDLFNTLNRKSPDIGTEAIYINKNANK